MADCMHCHQEKTPAEMHHARRKDGSVYQCRMCRRCEADRRRSRKKNPVGRREYRDLPAVEPPRSADSDWFPPPTAEELARIHQRACADLYWLRAKSRWGIVVPITVD